MSTHPVPAGRPDARAAAQDTYTRRRARAAAETLANIGPAGWDEATRRILLTLATIAMPSRIDRVLDDAFDPLLVPLPVAMCGSMHGHDSLDEAKACDDAPRARPTIGPLAPKPCTLRGLEPRRCAVPCGKTDCEVVCARMHDNGDYRA